MPSRGYFHFSNSLHNLLNLKTAPRYFFRKEQKLKSRKLIQQVFAEGKSINAFPIKAIWLSVNEQNTLQAGVSVSSRNFKKAVHRNRVKRLMREAFRLQKNILEEHLIEHGQKMSLFLLFTGKEIPTYQEVFDSCNLIIKKLINNTKTR